ncbi:hypothetical protein [Sphingomonas albertensis]|uniref:hypothetical protein n=1 Tax=Sphingomonas albertensis TaxID=2762591 RepID=UPI0037D99AD6
MFGHLKRNLKLRTLKLRGLAGAVEEFTLAAATYNLGCLPGRNRRSDTRRFLQSHSLPAIGDADPTQAFSTVSVGFTSSDCSFLVESGLAALGRNRRKRTFVQVTGQGAAPPVSGR